MKKLGILFATVIMIVLFALSVSAVDGMCGENLTWSYEHDSGTLKINGNGSMYSYYLNTPPWSDFAEFIYSIEIENGVTEIGDKAFSGCKNLKSIILPNTLIEIGQFAFSRCDNLKEISLPSSLTKINLLAFNNCWGLESIVIPNSVTEISDYAFSKCINLNSITFSDGLLKIGNYAFEECESLNNVKFPNGLTLIGDYAFSKCANLNVISMPNSIMKIGEGTFNKCINLEELSISQKIETIPKYAFSECIKLIEILMPNGVSIISSNAFYSCSSVKIIRIPKSISMISSNAFSRCTNLSDIIFEGSKDDWDSVKIGSDNNEVMNANIHYNNEFHLHVYTYLISKTPTCTTSGTKTFTCSCGDTYTETIPATNHPNATTDAGKSPTTIEVGYTAGKYCPDCETWLEGHEEIPMLHTHTYTSTVTKEATCWREGEKTYTCTCGDSYTEVIAKLDHEYRPWETKKNPTCTAPGLEWSYCLLCDNDFEREIPATGHTIIDYTRRATPDSDGAYVTACDVCNEVFKSISFGRPTEYKLSTTKYTYDGKTKTPKLTVETSDGVVLKEGVDYELELPSGRKAVGVYTYRVVFKGNFLGEKKVSYQILPGKTSSITATQSTSAIKLTWKKVTGADGYRVYQYNSKTGKYEKIKTTTGTSYTVKNLKAGTSYRFAVKAYTKADGETLWAASYKTITTTTKPATPTVKATAGSKKATISWNKVTGATGYVIYMQDEFGDYQKIGSTKNTSYTKKSLKKGKTYYFRVRAYKTVAGKNIYGGYKTVKVKVK